jgi:glycosyltransferase involved in cell wall biosynthesis
LVEHKNLDLLIDALSLMKNDGQEPKVVIVGDGPIRARLQEKSAAQGLNNVSFRADIESERTVYSLLKSARLFVLPSTREGFGLAALEAAAAGLPVATISHPSNGALDLVIGHHFGLASGPTPDEYAALIREILEDGQLHRTLSEYATVAAAEYNWPRVLPSIEREYSRLAARDPKVSNL